MPEAAAKLKERKMLIGANDISGCILAWTPGPWEIALVAIVILLLFGGKKLPELARGLGRGLRLFKKELKEVKEDIEEAADADEKPPGADEKPAEQKQDETREGSEEK